MYLRSECLQARLYDALGELTCDLELVVWLAAQNSQKRMREWSSVSFWEQESKNRYVHPCHRQLLEPQIHVAVRKLRWHLLRRQTPRLYSVKSWISIYYHLRVFTKYLHVNGSRTLRAPGNCQRILEVLWGLERIPVSCPSFVENGLLRRSYY